MLSHNIHVILLWVNMRVYTGDAFLQIGLVMFCWDPGMLLTWHHTSSLWGGVSQFTLRIPTLLLVQGFSTVVMVGICFQAIYSSFLYWGLVNLILVHGLFPPLMACKASKFHFSCEIWLFCKGKFPQNTWISFHSRHLALPNIILYNIFLLIYCFTASLPTRI